MVERNVLSFVDVEMPLDGTPSRQLAVDGALIAGASVEHSTHLVDGVPMDAVHTYLAGLLGTASELDLPGGRFAFGYCWQCLGTDSAVNSARFVESADIISWVDVGLDSEYGTNFGEEFLDDDSPWVTMLTEPAVEYHFDRSQYLEVIAAELARWTRNSSARNDVESSNPRRTT